jgi:hypothetical protein
MANGVTKRPFIVETISYPDGTINIAANSDFEWSISASKNGYSLAFAIGVIWHASVAISNQAPNRIAFHNLANYSLNDLPPQAILFWVAD